MTTSKQVIGRLSEMDDETLKQFCYDIFNHRFFEEFFDDMCYKHSDIWKELTLKHLSDANITQEEIDKFLN